MNDRYLYRAKRTDNGEWVEGLLWKKKYNSNKIFISCFPYKDDNEEVFVVDKNTICQCTGLKDKNGKLIWENDILLQKTTELHWCKWECIGVVKYGEHDWNVSEYGYTSIGFYVEPIVRKGDINKIACGLSQVDILDEYYPCEVIGNIFDNPELLEVGE